MITTTSIDVDIKNNFPAITTIRTHELNVATHMIRINLYDNGAPFNIDDDSTFDIVMVTDGKLVKEFTTSYFNDNSISFNIANIENENNFLVPGKMVIQVSIISGNRNFTLPIPIVVYVSDNIINNAKVTPESLGTVAEIMKEVAAARGEYEKLPQRLNEIAETLENKLDDTDNSVKSNNLADGAVTSDKLSDNAVTSDKIMNRSIGFEKLHNIFVKKELLVNLSSFIDESTGEYINKGRYYYNATDKVVGISNDSNYACISVDLTAGTYSVQNIRNGYSFYVMNDKKVLLDDTGAVSISRTFELPIDTTLYVSIKIDTTATGYETVAIASGDTIPEDISTLGIFSYDTAMELDSVKNLENSKKDKFIKSEEITLNLPSNLHLINGLIYDVFSSGVLTTKTGRTDLINEWSTDIPKLCLADKGIRLIPDNVGTKALSINVYDDELNKITSANCNVEVINDDKTFSGKVLFLGDSRTKNGGIVKRFKDLMGDRVELIGTQYTALFPELKCEGRNGWRAYDYCVSSERYGYTNPFYNTEVVNTVDGYDSHFDFGKYMQEQSYDTVNMVNIFLGANDGYTNSAISYIKSIIQSINGYSSNIKICVMTEYVSPRAVWKDGNVINRLKTRQNQFNYYNKIQSIGELDNVTIVPIHLVVDDFFHWKYEDVTVLDKTMSVLSDPVHLNNYDSLANLLYTYITNL
ncbi:MAG: SGNH/GDSL hydrolase family protein [Ruminococcus sp.]